MSKRQGGRQLLDHFQLPECPSCPLVMKRLTLMTGIVPLGLCHGKVCTSVNSHIWPWFSMLLKTLQAELKLGWRPYLPLPCMKWFGKRTGAAYEDVTPVIKSSQLPSVTFAGSDFITMLLCVSVAPLFESPLIKEFLILPKQQWSYHVRLRMTHLSPK